MEIAHNTAPARAPVLLSGSRRLFTGEDRAAYDTLLARVLETVKPTDVLEEIWLQDVVALTWEVARLRRAKVEYLNANAHRGLRKLLDMLLGTRQAQELTTQWAARNPEARTLVDKSLAAAGMTMDTVMAQTLAVSTKDVEPLERLAAAADLRRNALLREIADYRAVFAAHLRRAAADIQDAEFKVVSSQPALPAGEVK